MTKTKSAANRARPAKSPGRPPTPTRAKKERLHAQISAQLHEMAQQRALELGFDTFTAYLESVIADDLTRRQPHQRGAIFPGGPGAVLEHR